MTKGFHKKPSKRIPAKRRYKIEHKVREHNKKLRKQMKKKTFKKKQKDPGIPNSLPFKEQIISEIQEHKKRAEEYREMVKTQMKQKRLENRDKLKASNRGVELSDLVKSAESRNNEFENKTEQLYETIVSEKDTSNLKTFYKEFQKVVEASDIIIEVLDARDPIGSRCLEVENFVLKSLDKRIILLINKTDLIPRENLQKWLNHLRNEFPTLPFKASTQTQRHNLSRSKVDILSSTKDLLKSSKCLGADHVMKLLNNYCRNKDIKTSITVGVVGFPNVGKSSVINSLKRNQVCTVGATPGLTRTMQTVSLDKHIKLVDSPGVVFAKNIVVNGNQQMSSILALRNAIRIETLSDPILPIEALLNRVNRQDLMTFYRLTEFETVKEFLSLVAKRLGKMRKGGILDLNAAAKKVLQDWNCGKIKYYTLPPEKSTMMVGAELVQKMSKEFNINDFTYDQFMNIDDEDDDLPTTSESFVIDSLASETIDNTMEQDSELTNTTQIMLTKEQPSKVSTSSTANCDDVEMEELDGMQLNKSKKLQFKKLKKQRKREIGKSVV